LKKYVQNWTSNAKVKNKVQTETTLYVLNNMAINNQPNSK